MLGSITTHSPPQCTMSSLLPCVAVLGSQQRLPISFASSKGPTDGHRRHAASCSAAITVALACVGACIASFALVRPASAAAPAPTPHPTGTLQQWSLDEFASSALDITRNASKAADSLAGSLNNSIAEGVGKASESLAGSLKGQTSNGSSLGIFPSSLHGGGSDWTSRAVQTVAGGLNSSMVQAARGATEHLAGNRGGGIVEGASQAAQTMAGMLARTGKAAGNRNSTTAGHMLTVADSLAASLNFSSVHDASAVADLLAQGQAATRGFAGTVANEFQHLGDEVEEYCPRLRRAESSAKLAVAAQVADLTQRAGVCVKDVRGSLCSDVVAGAVADILMHEVESATYISTARLGVQVGGALTNDSSALKPAKAVMTRWGAVRNTSEMAVKLVAAPMVQQLLQNLPDRFVNAIKKGEKSGTVEEYRDYVNEKSGALLDAEVRALCPDAQEKWTHQGRTSGALVGGDALPQRSFTSRFLHWSPNMFVYAGIAVPVGALVVGAYRVWRHPPRRHNYRALGQQLQQLDFPPL